MVLALKTLAGQGFSGTAWLPAYACPSLPPVFRKERVNLRRYGVASNFRPVFPFPGPGEKDVVLLIHYFGFPNRRALEWFHSIPPEHRPFLIEDCAGASLAGHLGLAGDFALFSFRKFFEVPDGGALVSRFSVESTLDPADPGLARERDEAFESLRKGEVESGVRLLEKAEAHLDRDLPLLPRAPSTRSWDALGQISFEEEARRRRTFARNLLDRIIEDPGHSSFLNPLFPSIPEDAAPLVLPVEIRGERERLSSLLLEVGLECPFLWDLNPALRYSFPSEYRLGRRTVGLPIPSRERKEDFSAILQCLEFFSS